MRHVPSGSSDAATPLAAHPQRRARARCLHHPFEAQAERTPDAVALVAGREELTYAELEARANRLAHALVRRGAGPEVRVGVCLERTAELVVGLLAVLKAGAAYVPLDPKYPAERVGLMLDDSCASILLTQVDCLALVGGHDAAVLRVDADRDRIAAEPSDRPACRADARNLAYLIYTSGSTGRPKGVMIEHASAAAFLAWTPEVWPAEVCGGVLAATSICFDISIFEIFHTLGVGGTVILAENAMALPTLPARDRVTLVDTVPSAAAELLRAGGFPASVRVVNLAGEALKGSLVKGVYALPQVEAVYNLYGPTEDTTYSTFARVPRDASREPTIGRVVGGSRAYLLDPSFARVADGEVGEVFMAGAGVTRGYLGRPALTAERYLPDPFAEEPGARMYRVGDLARLLPDGELDCLGRLDHQVKVRGFRVELGEVEAALRGHPAVLDAAVSAPADPAGGRRLVGWLVAHDGAGAPAPSELRAWLGARLPAFMVPGALAWLPALPLNPNGKVDRPLLEARGWPETDDAGARLAPRTATETAMAEIWREVLGFEVGVEDAFDEVGGHSLAAMQVGARVRAAFGVEIPMVELLGGCTVASLAASVDAAGDRDAAAAFPPVLPVPRGGDLPLSYSQERVWFLTRLVPDLLAYQVQGVVRLEGDLDAAVLEGALNDVIDRHEVLRTTFHEVEGRPVQRIHPRYDFRLPIVDLAADEVDGWLREEFKKTFDLQRLLLVRWTLLRISPREHVLVHVEHHLIHDGWSLNLLLRDLMELYRARVETRAAVLPEMPVQFADYCVWQREWTKSAEAQRQLAFWREKLAGSPPVLELPTDRPRPLVQRFQGGAPRFALPATLYRRLTALSHAEGSTLFMTMLAAFELMLSRWSRQEDLNVATGIAVRRQAETEQVAGMFVNVAVLRTNLSGDPTFRELLARVRGTTLEAYANQDLPFDFVVEGVRPDRQLAHNPLFQVMFSFHDSTQPDLSFPGGRGELVAPLANGSAKFDLQAIVIPHPRRDERTGDQEALTVFWEYDSDLFDRATAERFFAHYRALLEEVAQDPGRRLSGYAMLAAAERAELVEALNDTALDYPRDRGVHALVEAQAARTPERVALEFGATRLTYAEVDRRANQVAAALRRRGVGPDVPVGVHLERSEQLIVAVLAVLKAGGVHLPLDPTFPPERLDYMLADAGARVLLTQERLRGCLAAPGLAVLSLDGDADEIGREAGEPVADPAWHPERLAYIIYTSGSTGRPKGVGVPHKGVVSLLTGMPGRPGIRADDVLLTVGTPAFDMANVDYFLPLSVGARVAVVTRDTAIDPLALARALEEHGATLLQATPVTFRMLLESGWEGRRGLRVLVAGEAVPEELARALAARVDEVWNMYGPTETTIYSNFGRIGDGRPVSVGPPVFNTRVLLLDRHLALVPRGSVGEVFIGGDGVSRGYLGRPGLTAERYLPDPYGPPGSRLYRSGDLGRWRPDGALDVLGRVDHQVKIRGFRIELGEIEAALQDVPGIRQAVVLAREDRPGERRLVGYATVEPGAALDLPAVKERLRRTLPGYMVPETVMVLDAFPLTGTGKVNRLVLPPPEAEEEEGPAPEAPRTPVEELVAGVWAEVLGVDQVGLDDDFFELGGHSLRATRVLARIRAAFGIDLPVRVLFDAPTVARLAARIEAARGVGKTAAAPLARVPRDRALPLTFMQQRLWFLERMQPGAATYNVPMGIRLRGELDVEALRLSLQEVVRRHESLRTTFGEAGGEPVQLISPPAEVALPFDVVPDDAKLRARLSDEARKPFDLEQGPLFRPHLFRVDAREHVLLLSMHHIVSDGWSHWVILRELAALYPGFAKGERPELPEAPVQYADFAAWQREHLQGEVLGEQLAWWTGHLRGAPGLLELPTDRPRPAVQRYLGAYERVELSPALTHALRALSRHEGATLYMTLLAAWEVLLGRYAGQDDLVVGTSIAGRTQPEVEGLVGFFANTLALRADLGGDPAFGALLARVREAMLGAYAHQELPFEKLVDELQPERSLSHNPLFQAFFALDNAGAPSIEVDGLSLSREDVLKGTAKFDLSLLLRERDGGLEGWVEYATDLFEQATVRRLVGHLGVLLEEIARDPSRRLSALPLMAPAERKQVVEEWAPVTHAPVEAPLHVLFERRAAAAPEHVAVTFEGERLTYGELNARANRLARYLRGRGVGAESRVGLCLERGTEMIVAILGVLKAGGGYVPLDPDYPEERLAYMVEDSGISILLTQRSLLDRLPVAGDPVCLDTGWEEIAEESGDDLDISVDPRGLAYVIYTSGSTGRPKGAMLTHANVVRLFTATEARFGFGPDDVWTMFHSYAFDFSVWEIWGALLHGGRLVVVPFLTSRSPEQFRRLLREEGVTSLSQTPSAFQQLVEADAREAEPLERLRFVVFGGEALQVEALRPWLDRYGPAQPRLINMYGITETCVHVTFHAIGGKDLRSAGVGSPIGAAIPDLRLYVLDPAMQPVPAGVPGELYVAGAGLARGYLGRPGLTAERFVPDPFGAAPGARLYRSGDRVRWKADGTLEYLGRIDQQVKLRGFRIELGEIEAALLDSPLVREAVVMVRGEGDERHLVGWVVPEAGAAPGTRELREAVSRRLPEYMVPAAFVVLEKLPLTNNGKVDRRALPEPDAAFDDFAGEQVAPRTPVEEVLAGIWAEVLKVERVGVHDDFFALGGHSLRATQVVSRAQEALGVEVPLRTLFEESTVAGLAAAVERTLQAGKGSAAGPIVPVGREGPLPVSFSQQRVWFLEKMDPGSATYNLPAALRLTGALDADALGRALNELVRRHEALRSTFGEAEDEPVQRVSAPCDVALPIEPVTPDTLAARLSEEARKPFDLEEGPFFRAHLFRLGEEEHALLLCTHHLASDGWSQGVLLSELSTLYGAYAAGQEPALPEPPVQFADFAAWQREHVSGDRLARQLAWWREHLAGAPAVLEFPTDRPRPAVQSFRGAAEPVHFPAELTEQLRALSRREGATLFMTLLAGWQLLLSRYSGQADVVVGAPIAGRTRPEVEGVVGFFANTLALRGDLSGDPSFRGLLARVRESMLGAYAHQELPFDHLVEALAPGRSLSHAPVFQVVLGLESSPARVGALGAVRAEPIEVPLGTSKFDLSLLLQDGEGGIEGTLGYSTDLFDAATVRRLLGHLTAVLEEAAAAPERRVSRFALIDDAERRTLLEAWGAAPAPSSEHACVHHLFEAQARRTPDATAIVFRDERLSYAELDARANRLARWLVRRGVGPDVRVGFCMERAPEMAVVLLGILKAGGAYVPLDPGYPPERLALMVREIGAPLLLAQDSLLDRLPADSGAVSIDTVWPEAAWEPGTAPGVAVTPEHLAYVIYTSGSTGTPKGSQIPHRAIPGFFRGADYAGFGAGEAVLQHSSTSWDALTLELWPALLSGGTCVLYPGASADLEGLAEEVRERGVTTLWLSAALFNVIADTRPEILAGVRQVMTGGEAVSPPHLRKAREINPALRVVNGYGPSECTVFASCWVVPPEFDGPAAPIGTPVGDRRVHLLDASMNLVPAGVPGELFVGGPSVPRGYLGRPALTAEKLVPDPFGAPGSRLYRTGDRVRWRETASAKVREYESASGIGSDASTSATADSRTFALSHSRTAVLEYVGRIDQQVKVRGFRVEPEEIEAVLLEHPAVREAVVVARDDGGEKRLVGYAVPADPAEAPSAEALREYLRGRLPDYLVPAALVVLDALPLTAHRKVDHAALPEPELAADAEYVAPRTPTEETLAGIFAAVLKLERVGVHDDFFALGGHSLRATQVASRARAALGVAVPLRTLFERPTVAKLAEEIEKLLVQGQTLDVTSVVPVPVPRRAYRASLADLGKVPE
ncbi:MAG: amino acid adenylation domain-containing protein [Longimicrobiaceae bacterium]